MNDEWWDDLSDSELIRHLTQHGVTADKARILIDRRESFHDVRWAISQFLAR